MVCQHNPSWNLSDLPEGVFAERLRKRALSYFEAGRKLIDTSPDLVNPIGFMLCHSIELALKSFLGAIGVTRKEMRSGDGHCLACLYEKAVKNGFVSSDTSLQNKMIHLSEYTVMHRYPDIVMGNRLAEMDLLNVAACVLRDTEAEVISSILETASKKMSYQEDIFTHGDGKVGGSP